MKMKTYCCTIILYLMAYCITLAEDTNVSDWGPVAENCQISIQIKNGGTEVKTNQPIHLIVRIRNLSTNESVTFEKWIGAEVFPLQSSQPIISQSSTDPFFAILNDGSFTGSMTMATVPPRCHYEYKFNLDCIKESVTNGVYKIVAKKKTVGGHIVMSNPLYLKIAPGEWKDPDPYGGFP